MLRTKLRPKRLKELKDAERKKIIKRCEVKWEEVINKITPIMRDVKNGGDKALVFYTKKFDGVDINQNEIEAVQAEIDAAYKKISGEELKKLREMKGKVSRFHSCKVSKSWRKKFYDGESEWGKQITPVDRVGVYIPGGKYNYPTTAMMAIIPAKVAGVKDIIAVTPPKNNGRVEAITLVAMDMAGATKIFKVGGAQAIAALTYGTETIPKVDLIVGPGNMYVNSAKKWLNMTEGVRIDLPAGPSEILIIADNTANPRWITRDMISQAEHDENACAILVTDSKKVANETFKDLCAKTIDVSSDKRIPIAIKSFENFGAILLVDNLDEAVEFANEFAPEHLEIITGESRLEAISKKIKHAGSIFLGKYSTVAAADYNLGTNHILPTGGAARRYSALSTETFQKISMVQKLTKKALEMLDPGIETLSKAEGLFNMHGLSVKIRLRKRKKTKKQDR